MNGFSLTDITAHPQFAEQVVQQPDQTDLIYSANQLDSLSLSFLFVVCFSIAVFSFLIGFGVGRQQHTSHHKLIAIRLRQIQTLERIWHMKAEHKD